MMQKGYIVRLLPEKRFGFISNGKDEFFFHKQDMKDDVWRDVVGNWENEMNIDVTFEAVDAPKGPRAANIKLI